MPYPFEPSAFDSGIVLGDAFIPATPPLSYIPSKGEVGVSDGKLFLPLEPFYHPAYVDDLPLIKVTQPIDRTFPWIEQTGMQVATPCISPHDWSLAAADRTLILDTVPDAIASDDEKALPGYVPNPGLMLSSRTMWDFDTETTVAAINIDTGKTYRILTVGTTDFVTDFGASANTVGIQFVSTADGAPTSGTGTATHLAGKYNDKDGVGFRWTYGASPTDPHPALRAGQTRYPGISGAAVGTVFDGTPFIPSPLENGNLWISAYRYGLFLSAVGKYAVKVKLGRAKATWSKTAQTLTLETTQTTGTTIKYTLNDGALTTYSTPIAITDTSTVAWYAEKSGMETSDTWSTYLEYQDEMPPDDFETFYFSTLPAIGADQNTTVDVALQFQRKPEWYISPAGAGNGLTAATPSNATDIIGLSTAEGKAYGSRTITATESGTANMTLASSGAAPSGMVTKYSEDGTTFSTYSAPITPAAPGRVWFKLVRADATDFTRRFMQPWFIGTGTGVQINAKWDLSEQTLTLIYEPTPLESADIAILYSLDGSTPSLVYNGPITLSANCTPKVKAIHAAREPHDFSTSTGVYTCSAIDIVSTADYDEDHAATWTADATIPTQTHKQSGDLIWCSEGIYENPTGNVNNYFKARPGVIVKGGYNADFTERDVKGRKTIFKTVKWGSVNAESINTCAFYVAGGAFADGLWFDSDVASNLSESTLTHAMYGVYLDSGACHNCHVDWTVYRDGGIGGIGLVRPGTDQRDPPQKSYLYVRPVITLGYSYLHDCSISVDAEVGKGTDGAVGPDVTREKSAASYAGLGGPSAVGVWLAGSQSTAIRCAFNIRAVSGGGGNGGTGGTAIGTSTPPVFVDHGAWSIGGTGGTSEASADCACKMYDCTCNMEVDSGDGGNGGAGGTASSYMFALSLGGTGGYTSASGSAYGHERCAIDASVTSGHGGNGGAGGTSTNHRWGTPGSSDGGRGVWSSVGGTTQVGSCGALELVAVSGDGGNGGVGTGPYARTGSGGDTVCNMSSGNASHLSSINAQVAAGAAGTGTPEAGLPPVPSSSVARLASVLGYKSLVHGSITGATKGYWACGASPCFFEQGGITITESAPYGSGNPVRVNHAADSTIGWYSGLDDSDGAPLTGYETSRGTGVALGRYWE